MLTSLVSFLPNANSIKTAIFAFLLRATSFLVERGIVLTYCFMLITYNTPSSSLDMGYDDLSAVGPYNQGNYSVNTKVIAEELTIHKMDYNHHNNPTISCWNHTFLFIHFRHQNCFKIDPLLVETQCILGACGLLYVSLGKRDLATPNAKVIDNKRPICSLRPPKVPK